jgi:hypothetical protein
VIDVKRRLERAMDTGRGGMAVSAEDAVVAALVASPFAGAFGIWLSWLTWWPNPVIWVATAVVQVGATLWIAGHRRAAGSVE